MTNVSLYGFFIMLFFVDATNQPKQNRNKSMGALIMPKRLINVMDSVVYTN